jgi:hypothetical protein
MKTFYLPILAALLFFSHPISAQVTVTSSNLPLVVIDTKGQTILDGSKIDALMKLISNSNGINKPTDPGNNYNGHIGIEYRGGKAKPAEQNPYNFETRDAAGANLNVSLLGMPEENDWILLANYNDKTLIRNALSFEIFRKMAHYSPQVKMVEVIINNEYQGIFFLAEKIKQDKGRVDISKLTNVDVSGDALTGGYIFKIDSWDATNSWLSNYNPIDHPEKTVHFVYDYPDPTKLVTQQKDYLKTAVNSFEKVLYGSGFKDPTTGYPAWIKMNSWLDFFIVSEVSRNINAYKKNCYYFKDKDSKDKKIHSGPVWDFDSGYKNLDDCAPFNATDGSGWSYKINDCPNIKTNSNGWIVRLLQDPAFASSLNSRYFLMRNSFISSGYINNFIDSVANLAKDAQVRHYTKWNILSSPVGDAEVDAQPATYAEHVTKLKNWIQTRLNWLDVHIPSEITSVSDDQLESEFSYRIFPNPTSDRIYIEASSEIQDIQIVNNNGQVVMHLSGLSVYDTQLNVSHLSTGIYMLLVRMDGKQQVSSKMVVQ